MLQYNLAENFKGKKAIKTESGNRVYIRENTGGKKYGKTCEAVRAGKN
jgi:hypothetical protein